MKYKLAINEKVDEDATNSLIIDLKRTIRYGKIAEQALKNIREKGFHVGKVCTVEPREWGVGRNIHDLAEATSINRSMAPSFTDFEVELGKIEVDHHGGHEFNSAPVSIKGTIFSIEKPGEFEYTTVPFGMVRFKKNSYSLELGNSYINEVVKLYTSYESPKAQKVLERVSNTLADYIVRDYTSNQLLYSFHKEVPKWIFDEGVTKKFLTDILELAKIYSVQGA